MRVYYRVSIWRDKLPTRWEYNDESSPGFPVLLRATDALAASLGKHEEVPVFIDYEWVQVLDASQAYDESPNSNFLVTTADDIERFRVVSLEAFVGWAETRASEEGEELDDWLDGSRETEIAGWLNQNAET